MYQSIITSDIALVHLNLEFYFSVDAIEKKAESLSAQCIIIPPVNKSTILFTYF